MKERLFLLLALAACADPVDELLPQLRSELQPGTELRYVRVETLDPSGDSAIQVRWLSVGAGCQLASDGRYDLGSFSVEKGEQPVSRMRLTAYGDRDGKAVALIEQRADAEFQRGQLVVPILFARQCVAKNGCAAGTTCDPATGSCGMIPRFPTRTDNGPLGAGSYCLDLLEEQPDIAAATVADPQPRVLCVPGDDVCPPGCDGTRDADCRPSLGEPCGNGQEACTAGTLCVHGVCCEQACTGSCERCDLPDQQGYCRPLVYSQPTAPPGSPDFSAQCDDHVDYTCTRGACTSACDTSHFDCDGDLQANGCETEAGTPYNCQRCSDACPYGDCGPDGCAFHVAGLEESSSSAPVEAGTLYAIAIPLQPGHTKLRALGALVHPALTGRSIRIALYREQGTAWELFDYTEPLDTRVNTASTVQAPSEALRIEARLAGKELPANGNWKIAFQVSETTQLYAQGVQQRWAVEPLIYGEFPLALAAPPSVIRFPLFNVYAVTTPK
jgi:hypothetical protein